ncbi:MAG: glycosyltransferase family 4 protein [Desmonostoc vinosum HA7617-LM4]|jgi:glycosyltransferase involved in cell wall biosynthesis|nr:glycosyltransferase family 4 protein [Desmonostoc vinosum HA7617-LM4]
MDFNVIVASPVWSLNGVNIFSANLVRGLRERGISAHILLTQPDKYDPKPMQLPSDIPIEKLPVEDNDGYVARWLAMINYLEERTPCIYIPNYDFEHSCVSPKLSNRVGIVGVVHSDDSQHYEHVSRLGKYWDAIAAVSHTVAKGSESRIHTISQRIVTIPIGVAIPDHPTKRSFDVNAPLKILYAGVFKQSQKRILDLPKIITALLDLKIPVELTLAGGGPDQQQLMDASEHLVKQGVIRFVGIIPHEKIPELLQQHDVFIMTSAFEGMPNALLEAMGSACVPVVTDIKSGIPELVQDGFNGYLLSVGDIQGFAKCLAKLQQDINLRQQMALNAYKTVDQGTYRIRDMVESYLELFRRVLRDAESGAYCRPHGRILPPPSLQPIWKHYLPPVVLKAARYGKRTFRKVAPLQS